MFLEKSAGRLPQRHIPEGSSTEVSSVSEATEEGPKISCCLNMLIFFFKPGVIHAENHQKSNLHTFKGHRGKLLTKHITMQRALDVD